MCVRDLLIGKVLRAAYDSASLEGEDEYLSPAALYESIGTGTI